MGIDGRRSIMEIYHFGKQKDMPKYGDFLIRSTGNGEPYVVEIFKDISDEGIVRCLAWWNFKRNWGDIRLVEDPYDPICMGYGSDTYIANNYEIEKLINKLNEKSLDWDFENKQLKLI